MAGLSLTQIINRLNEEFTGDTRKLVFWYYDNGEFVGERGWVKMVKRAARK